MLFGRNTSFYRVKLEWLALTVVLVKVGGLFFVEGVVWQRDDVLRRHDRGTLAMRKAKEDADVVVYFSWFVSRACSCVAHVCTVACLAAAACPSRVFKLHPCLVLVLGR